MTLTLKEVEVEEEEASEALAVTGRGPAEADPFDVLALEQVEGRNRKFDLPDIKPDLLCEILCF